VSAHELRAVPGQRDGLGQGRLLGRQLRPLLFILRAPRLRPPPHEPGGAPRRKVAVPARPGGIAAPVALRLEALPDLPGVRPALVPGLEEESLLGVQEARPAPFLGALRTGRAAEIPQHGRFPHPPLLRPGLPSPALTT
jgi:hypothetical protein